jgi:hypothetical protein
MNRWLSDFTYRIPREWWIVAAPVCCFINRPATVSSAIKQHCESGHEPSFGSKDRKQGNSNLFMNFQTGLF